MSRYMMEPATSLFRRLFQLCAPSAGTQCARKSLWPASSSSLLQSKAAASPTSPRLSSKSPFSTTSQRSYAQKRVTPARDRRITLVRYMLHHPLTPRPLRFSRLRHLRHWTIHRAYQLQRVKDQQARERELERMYNAQREACEELRLLPGNDGRLFRRAMVKKGIYTEKGGWPIEASRSQTEWPAKEAWDGNWRR